MCAAADVPEDEASLPVMEEKRRALKEKLMKEKAASRELNSLNALALTISKGATIFFTTKIALEGVECR